MKRIVLTLTLILLCSNAFATSYVPYVTINPYVDVRYSRNSTPSLAGDDWWQARIDAEIRMEDGGTFIGLQPFTQFVLNYNKNYIDIIDINNFDPATWGGTNSYIDPFWQYTLSNGDAATHLTFFINYTLDEPASTKPSRWSSIDEWAMNGSITPEGCPTGIGYSSHLVPEPGSLLLLGFGFLSFGAINSLRKRKRS